LAKNRKHVRQQWLYTHASDPSPRQIRSKSTLMANLLARCIAYRWVTPEKKLQNHRGTQHSQGNFERLVLVSRLKIKFAKSKIVELKSFSEQLSEVGI
jgi:hypothetical protein